MISEKIKTLRCRMGWCQTELAMRVGVDLAMVQLWELGEKEPSDEALRSLDDLFHQSTASFVETEPDSE